MEDLALLVSAIVIGLLVLGFGAVVLAILARKMKISKYWPLGAAVALTILSLIAWQGSDRLGMIPLGLAVLTAAITYWPASKAK
jgi:uncharacterized membrane protein YbhN (UPF0104 family)